MSVLYGEGLFEKRPNAEAVVSTANQLRNYFAQKRYQKNGFALNAQLGEGTILVFQGKDQEGQGRSFIIKQSQKQGR